MKNPSAKRSEQDEALLQKIFGALTAQVTANPYGWDGELAKQICGLPVGLRAMAATHHLDISLTLDDLGWHFLNFGEENHVKETEFGLRELGMTEMANLFAKAYRLIKPLLPEIRQPGGDYEACLKASGKMKRIDELGARAWALQEESGVYAYWLKYARSHPEKVFSPET